MRVDYLRMMRAGSDEVRRLWTLDPGVAYLNHGSFGACPVPVLDAQRRWRDRMERQPVAFLSRDLEGLLHEARVSLGAFVGASPDDLAFVPNATAGTNAVLRSVAFEPGDEVLTTTHAYNAAANAMRWVADRAGARVVAASVPFPIEDPRQVIDGVLAAATTRTRLAVIDHISSATALVFPIERIVAELGARGIDVLVDGAHAPGSVPLDLASLGAAYYVGNCHKWMCAPKGSGFLWARADRQNGLEPTVVSHGANSGREDRSRFRELFDWTGTADPTPYLAVPESIACMGSVLPGGWDELMSSNRALALRGRELLCEALGIEEPAPSSMIASMSSVPIWDRRDESDNVTTALLDRGIEVLIEPWPSKPHRVLRISAQVYNREAEYRMLAEALKQLAG